MRLPEGRALRREAEASRGETPGGSVAGSPPHRARGGEEVLYRSQTAPTSAVACGPATVITAALQRRNWGRGTLMTFS